MDSSALCAAGMALKYLVDKEGSALSYMRQYLWTEAAIIWLEIVREAGTEPSRCAFPFGETPCPLNFFLREKRGTL